MGQDGTVGYLEVTRPRRGTTDVFRSYSIMVDGAQIGSLKRGHSQLVPVSCGRHEVHVEIDWCRSSSIEVDVAPGQTTRLSCWAHYQAWHYPTALANPNDYLILAQA